MWRFSGAVRCSQLLLHLQDGAVVPKRTLFSGKKGINRDYIAFMQQPINLSPASIRKWYKRKMFENLRKDHSLNPERQAFLGSDLAAAHFLVARGGAIKFVDSDSWVEKKGEGELNLPKRFVPNLCVEAIDASGTEVMYESFDNLEDLKFLRYLNVSGCEYIDDWCLDRFQRYRNTLYMLDVSNCPNVSERGLASLHRFKNLKRLRMHNMPAVKNPELLILSLEEALPGCIVDSDVDCFAFQNDSISEPTFHTVQAGDLESLPGVVINREDVDSHHRIPSASS